MKKFSLLALGIWMVIGMVGCDCEESNNEPSKILNVIQLNTNDYGHWRLIELEYNGAKHVFLSNYDRDNQGIAKVCEIPLSLEAEVSTKIPSELLK